MIDDATAVLCELASLHALGGLDEADARRFEEHLVDGCPVCRHELASLKATVDLLAFAPPPVLPPASLRQRVLESARASTAERSRDSGQKLELEDEGPWKPYSVPGIDYRMLHLDRASREIVMLVRAQAGAEYPIHAHAAPEDMFMLRGELRLDGTTYRPGDFIRSPQGSHHGVGETPTGCMFLMRGSIDDLVFVSGDSSGIGTVTRPTP